ncbi:MAG TPA: c-type cytochrome [Gemmataceae bacterium]|nr:c-type cytochrome [Gemmataceae bacterium]
MSNRRPATVYGNLPSFVSTFIVLALTPITQAQALKAPPGFEVVEFADGKLANDIQVMTIDPKGRIVVAGRGYIRILVDDDGDGRADRALDFAATPKDGAMGMLWEGDTLYVTGDGGLRSFTSKTGDKADGPSKLIRAIKTGGEHSAHAIQRGPDGWLYVLCGNNAGIDRSYAELPTSPIKEPIAGCVLRFSPEGSKCEIVAHGFRNPYAFDFNLNGDLFTFDSDNERCVSLPWYEPTRFYHVIEGRHYGWLNPQRAITWRRPPYFCDVVAPAATLGRGSPTGVACYRHNQFPPEFHGGFFLCDWTFGKVHFAELRREDSTYTAKTRVFLESLGDNGFAPTSCVVHPQTGDLYVSIGGRGTRGAVYRIRHSERFKAMQAKLTPLPMAKRPLDWNDAVKKEYETKIRSKSGADQLRALQIARRQQSFLGQKDVTSPFESTVYYDDLVVRNAQADLIADLLKQVTPRQAVALKAAFLENDQPGSALHIGLGILHADPRITLNRGLFLLRRSKIIERRIEGIRMVQLGLGDIGDKKSIGTLWEGYSPRADISDTTTAKILAPMFPSPNVTLDRELARTLGMLGHDDAALRGRILAKCGPDSTPMDDIHYLACYARLAGKRDAKETTAVATALLDLDRKIRDGKLNRDSNWPLRVRELYVGLADKDPALHEAMVAHASFGRPDHALFAGVAGFPKARAARVFFGRWQRDKDFALTSNIVQLFDVLPADTVLPTVRSRWGETGQETSFLPLLAKKPIVADRARFVDGLNSPQGAIIEACVRGLDVLDAKTDASESFALIRALHRSSDKQAELRTTLASRLQKTTGQSFGVDSKRWTAWLQKQHPEFGVRLANPDGVDVAKWDKRFAGFDWDKGNADAGRTVFTRASCVNCHGGSQAVGPDLVGVTKRFSRADLLTAILQPSKDVPARYQTTLVETQDGKTYQGIIIYDAVDNLILQTGAATTIRVDGSKIVGRSVSAQSLMPTGLLDALSDREIVDLIAYLRSR